MPNSTDWPEKIQQLKVVQAAGLLGITALNHGTSNRSFKVDTEAGSWVVRFNGELLGVDRQQEARILELIQGQPVAPTVIEIRPSHLITEWVPHPAWQPTDLLDFSTQQQLAELLQPIHQLPYEHLPSRLDQRIHRYLRHIPEVPEALAQSLRQRIAQLENAGFWAHCQFLYHSDLNPHNLLGKPHTTVIDWEFAGQGHALLDWLIMEHEFKVDLSAHYPSDSKVSWINPLKVLIANLMQLWQLTPALNNPPQAAQ